MMSVWDKYPNYDENELKLLVRAAAEMLAEAGLGNHVPEDVLDLSDKAAAEEIRTDLAEIVPDVTSEQIRRILRDSETSRRIVLAALEEVRRQPELALAVDDIYQRHMRQMGDPMLLLAVAPLLVLTLRIQSFECRGLVIKFHKSTEAIKAFAAGLVSAFKGQIGNAP